MQENSGFAPQKRGEKLAGALRAHPETLVGMLCALGGFFCALAKIDGGAAPFGAAYAAGAPQLLVLPAALGAALGYLASGSAAALRSCGAVLLCAVARLALGARRWDRLRGYGAPILAGGAVLAAGVIPVFYADPLVYDVIMWSAQIVMAAAAASFMEKAFAGCAETTPARLLARIRQDKLTAAAAIVIGAIALMGLDAVTVSGVSLGRIAAAAAVLFAAAASGEAASALTGVVCGLVIGFSTGEFSLYVTSYSMGGLLAGLFSAFGRRGSAATFAAVYGMFGLLMQKTPAGLIEVALAAAVFLLLPQGLIDLAGIAAAPAPDLTLRDLSVERLETAAKALREVSRTTEDVATQLKAAQDAARGGLCDAVAQTLCGGCPYRCACWQEHPEETQDALRQAAALYRSRGEISPALLPSGLNRCAKKAQLADCIRRCAARDARLEEKRADARRCRAIVTGQLEAAAALMTGIADDIAVLRPAPAGLMQRLTQPFVEQRAEPKRMLCWRDEYTHLTLRATLPNYRAARLDPVRLTQKLSEAAGVPLALPERAGTAHETTLEFHQKPLYALETAVCRIPADEGAQCGDTVRQITTPGGAAHLLLSDGMGSGMGAALDSAMASLLAECLLEADVDHQSTLRLINTALLVKSGEKSLATLDALRIDLYTGMASFFKAGAASSLLLKNGRVTEIAAQSLPAGILDGVDFSAQQRSLLPGDVVLLYSDGVCPEGAGWVIPLLENWKGSDLENFCSRLAKTAQLRRSDGRQDDITVAAARLCRL